MTASPVTKTKSKRKEIMFKETRVRNMFIGLVLISVLTLAYAEWMVWKETTNWLSNYMVEVIQEDNSFLAQDR